MIRHLIAALAGLLVASTPHLAGAVEVCAWIEETVGEDDYRQVALWLQADEDVDIYYMIKGAGLSGEGMKAHSPSSGTFFLKARTPEKPWTFGATLTPPGEIDILAEVHAPPADIFSDDEPPLLAAFSFRREVPEGETSPPPALAARQCASLPVRQSP
jgi:hypothetical protein